MSGDRLAVVVLAAGEGKRMKSSLPKVLHRVAGRSLLGHVVLAVESLDAARTIVVASARRSEIESALDAEGLGDGITYVVQDPPSGTGDAARIALDALGDHDGPVLIVPGDTPLLTTETLASLAAEHRSSEALATLLTAPVTNPAGYGRVVRTSDGAVVRVVEERDATAEELLIHEINTSVYVFDARRLAELLQKIDTDNDQGEYYLTDVIELIVEAGDKVAAHRTDEVEVGGVNSRVQLARAGAALRARSCERWMLDGVTIVDPATTYIDSTVTFEPDSVVHPFTFLEGTTHIGEGAEVGPQTRIVSSEVHAGAKVTYSIVQESVIGPEASVGPFASLRTGTRLERGAKVGTFVESKKAHLGEGSKANHLAYLGDAEIGRGVNVGAGSITCNWDGQDKHRTVIDDDAYIGSDTMLVAPTRIGRRAATGAGAVVRGEVPDDALAVGAPARILKGRGNKMGRKSDDSDQTRDN